MNIQGGLKVVEKTIKKNLPTILTWCGIGCFTAASVYTCYGTVKAVRKIDQEECLREELESTPMSKKEIIGLVWPAYVPSVLLIGAGTACVLTANHINLVRIETLAGAYLLSKDKLKEAEEKIDKLTGVERPKKLEDKWIEERNDLLPWEEPELSEPRKVLIKDASTGRRWRGTRADVDKAVVEFNNWMMQNGTGYLNDFYDILGLSTTDMGRHMRISNHATGRILEITWSWENNDQDIDEPILVFDTNSWGFVRE